MTRKRSSVVSRSALLRAFARPAHVAAFAVAVRRVGLPVLLAAATMLTPLGCKHGGKGLEDIDGLAAGTALALSDVSIVDVLFWSLSAQGEPMTAWVRGSASEFRVLATRPGVTLPVPGSLVSLEETTSLVDLEECLGPQAKGGLKEVSGQARSLQLVDLLSGQTVEVYAPPLPEEGGVEDFEARAVPIASVGTMVVLRIEEDVVHCAMDQSSRNVEVLAFDVGSGKPFPLFSAIEEDALQASEKATAFELLRGNRALRAKGPRELFLRDLEFRLSGRRGLTLSYVFTQGDEEAEDTVVRFSSALSVSVPARAVPASFAPGLIVPPVLVRLLEAVPDLEIYGWAPILLSAADVPTLLLAFAGGQEKGKSAAAAKP
ncbi:MAG: hypothetical protein MUC50_21915 [Myxococcota bacterium]|nr:hypothetical protein [Myxococcota bacterium]